MPTRRITYADQLAVSLFALQDAKQRMLDEGFLAQAILGITTQLDGFECTPSDPADLTVNVAGGTIFKYQNVDNTAFGTLPSQIPADTANQVVKYATELDSTPFTITPPVTVGFSRNDLIQINFEEADGDLENIPFWNGTNVNGVPNPPNFQNQNVLRIDSVIISVVTGVAATTGTQVTPAPSAGYVGAWVITTANGQTTITSGDIERYPTAPFILEKLKDKISLAPASEYFAPIENGFSTGDIKYGAYLTPDAGWLLCDHSAVSRTTYAALFNRLKYTLSGSTTSTSPIVTGISSTANLFAGMPVEGTGIPASTTRLTVDSGTQITLDDDATATGTPTLTFFPCGNGNGSTTFNLPNHPGRSPLAAGSGSGLTVRKNGQVGGEELHELIQAELADHKHSTNDAGTEGNVNYGNDDFPLQRNTSTGGATTSGQLTSGIFGSHGDGHNTMHPYLVLNAFIKT
jgi:microcystin-dependent protein